MIPVDKLKGIAQTMTHHAGRHQSGIRSARRALAVFAPLVLLGACGPTGQQHTVRLLDSRLRTQLASDIQAGRAAVQQTPDGARVTLLSSSLFPNSDFALDDKYSDIRANVIEGMLDPSLMQVRVADTSTLPDTQRETRVNNVNQYFIANGLQETLQPGQPLETAQAAAPAGLAITISVQCPHRHDGTGYDNGLSKPTCD